MRWHIWIDECMPRSFQNTLIKAIKRGEHADLCNRIKWHSVDEKYKALEDVEWIQKARSEAGDNYLMIITQDGRIRKRPHEYETLLESCEVAIFLYGEKNHQDAMVDGVIESTATAIAHRLKGNNKFEREIDISLKPPHRRHTSKGKTRKR